MAEAAAATGYADRFRPLELAVTFDPGLVARRPRRQGPVALAPVHQCPGHRAGDVHPPRRVRHRLPGPRPQHPRPQLPPAGGGATAPRSGRSPRPLDRAGGRRLDRPRRPDRRRRPSAHRRRRRGSWWSRRARSGRPSSCSGPATSRRRCPACRTPLGSRWSSNGDFLTIGLHPTRDVRPTDGPTITSAIDFRDGSSAAGRSSSRTAAFPTCRGLRPGPGPVVQRLAPAAAPAGVAARRLRDRGGR